MLTSLEQPSCMLLLLLVVVLWVLLLLLCKPCKKLLC
jgi:hypothetical protein